MKKVFLPALFVVSVFNGIYAQTSNPAPYCNADFDDAQGFLVDDHINSVSFGTLNNVTNGQYAGTHYVFYNNLNTVSFLKGNSYTLSINFTTAGGCGYGVWIDYNQNNIFEASEKIAGTTGTNMLAVGASPSITQSITIPTNAVTGNTRMRIRIVEDDNYNMTTTDELPCNASTSATDVMDWGETEDYTINITASSAGINEATENHEFSVYPNPVKDQLFFTANKVVTECQITALTGQVMNEKTNVTGNKMDISKLSSGIYFVELFNSQESLGKIKFIKE